MIDQLITGSWDRTVKLWDPRKGNPNSLISSHEQPERVYSLDLVENTLLVATAGRRFMHYDIRKMDAPIEDRPSAMKFGTTSLSLIPTGEGALNSLAVPYLSDKLSKAMLQEQLRDACRLNISTSPPKYRRKNMPSSAIAKRSPKVTWSTLSMPLRSTLCECHIVSVRLSDSVLWTDDRNEGLAL